MAAFIETAQKVHKNEPNKNRETFISLGKFLFYSLVKNSIDNISKDFSETFCFEELKEKSTKELMRLQEQRKSLRKELSDLEKPPKPRTKPTPKIKHQFKKPSKKFMDLRKKFEKK